MVSLQKNQVTENALSFKKASKWLKRQLALNTPLIIKDRPTVQNRIRTIIASMYLYQYFNLCTER